MFFSRHVSLNLANKITLLRILCIPLFIAATLYLEAGRTYMRPVQVIIFFVAVISDALDGFIARIYNQQTQLGTWLDPIADKLLLITSFILLASLDGLPHLKLLIWLVVIVLSRDILIVCGCLLIHMIKGKLNVHPSASGKITTFLQMMTIVTRLVGFPYFLDTLWALTAIFTLLSGFGYLIQALRQLHTTTDHREITKVS